ncbi:MAG: NAD(P)/FAD-dependent oxidoreductase [Cyanobacteria bacterium J06555_13]
MSEQGLSVAVIGGGAAGFFGAIAAASTHPHAQVTLYEAGPQPLAKVRISGGGRCNVTHHCFDPAQLVQSYPRGGKALRGAFSRFQPKDTVQWFTQRGVKLKTEADGRMFPTTDDSATVVNCLERAAESAGVQVKVRSPIVSAKKVGNRFKLRLKSQQVVECDRLLLTTGSSPTGHRIAEALGHQLERPVPSLFTFNIADKRLHQLSGVAVSAAHVRLKVEGASKRELKALAQTGPLLITHWGLSGPAVLKLSAWAARSLYEQKYRAQVLVNWLPEWDQAQVRSELQQIKGDSGKKAIATYSPFSPISKRLWQYLIARIDIDTTLTWANLSKKQLNRLVTELTQGTFAVTGKGVFKDEFVTCGGVRLKEVDFKTMESRVCSGLYLSGEILNIDGVTGGFNFQSAWTTGWLAGQAIGYDG